MRQTGFFATSIRCFRGGLVKDSTEDLRNRDLLSLNGRPRDCTTTPMRARIERRNRRCPLRLAIRFSSAATHLKIRKRQMISVVIPLDAIKATNPRFADATRARAVDASLIPQLAAGDDYRGSMLRLR